MQSSYHSIATAYKVIEDNNISKTLVLEFIIKVITGSNSWNIK